METRDRGHENSCRENSIAVELGGTKVKAIMALAV
jgi:hypothetical protein